jgi:hypothetical protein
MARRQAAASQGFGWGCGLILGVAAALAALVAIPILCCGGFGLLGLAAGTGRSSHRGAAASTAPAPAAEPRATHPR